MKTILIILFLFTTTALFAVGDSVVSNDQDYYTYTRENIEIIYTKDNLPFAKHTASIESPLNRSYENSFDWKFDETLYVGLISDYNQIANGFSTQWPNNRQINYVGGTQLIDYFTTTSWLDTLLYHETAHNYQINVKGSSISRGLHSVFGNGFIFFLPLSVPNVMENSFMLEGNAVLNESWHGNGGRLYSGRFKVQTILQAKAGKIIPSDVYNAKLAFPYSDILYIQGGFFNLFLAQKYGIDKVNSYFKEHSKDFLWPQFTNASMKIAVGLDFEESIAEFADEYASLSQDVVLAKGEHIASSQFFSSLGNDEDEIFFLTNEGGYSSPELTVINKASQSIKKAKESWVSGKVIKDDGEYYTQGSRHTSVSKIHQGLFCNQGFIKKGTKSKMVQGYLSDGKEVYFDVPSSYREPQLYVDGEFYTQVNSSVVIDKADNLYYFVQRDKTRTLYKNKTPLYSYEGFYGIVSDVDTKGTIYFVANSELGSTLYAYMDGKVSRSSEADNIVEARLLNDTELLIAAISEKDYYYVKSKIRSINKTPYVTRLFFEDEAYYASIDNAKESIEKFSVMDELNDSYSSLLDMHYSGTDFIIGSSSDGGVTGSLGLNFGDPLSQNAARAYLARNESNITIAGLEYTNAQYLLQYSLSVYSVIEDNKREDVRDNGVILGATLPVYNAGYYYGALSANYYQDYETTEREPLSFSFEFERREAYAKSMYLNYLNSLKMYGVSERDDTIYGGEYNFKYELAYESYFGFGAKYSRSDADTWLDVRGVKLTNTSYQLDKDPSTIEMPSLGGSLYAKSTGYGEISLAKVFNFSSYFFTFPISLQRESLYLNYRYYDIENFSSKHYEVNELRAGLTLSTVFLNSFVFPLSVEYIYNDADFVTDKNSVRFLLGANF